VVVPKPEQAAHLQQQVAVAVVYLHSVLAQVVLQVLKLGLLKLARLVRLKLERLVLLLPLVHSLQAVLLAHYQQHNHPRINLS
jgi:hypothetical protein